MQLPRNIPSSACFELAGIRHWKTYQLIKNYHDALVQVSLHDMGRKLGLLHKLLGE
jgi:hypothetical protein